MHGTEPTRVLPGEVHVSTPTGFAFCVRQKVYLDDRGYLVVDFQDATIDQDCMQIYHSLTKPGKARDENTWHIHNEQTDRFVILSGAALFGLSNGEITQVVVISSHNPYILIVPPGVYHCFRTQGPEPVLLLNVPNRLYNPQDEGRVPFMELEAPHPW